MKSKTRRCRYLKRPATRILSLIVSLAMLFSITAGIDLSVYADSGDFEYGDYVCYQFNDNTISIKYYIGSEQEITIPSTINGCKVVSVGSHRVFGKNLKKIIIPDTVDYISQYAFQDCSNLKSVVIPDSVKEIGEGAFRFTALEEINIPKSVEKLGKYLFIGCLSLKKINVDKLNKNYSSLDGVLFDKNKTKLISCPCAFDKEEYELPNTVKTIGDSSFDNVSKMRILTLGQSVESIGYNAVYNCDNLLSVKILNPNCEFDWDSIYTSYWTKYNQVYIIGYKNSTAQEFVNSEKCESNVLFADISEDDCKNKNHKFSEYTDNNTVYNFCVYCGCEKPSVKFEDLQNKYYSAYTDYVLYTSVYNSFLKGTNPPYYTEFSPNAPITRAMFVTILYRMAGEPYKNTNPYRTSPFSDIKDKNAYYYDAACWALKNGVTTETTFKPFNAVTREQTATFLYRYAQDNDMLGDADYKNVNLNAYHDGNSISHFAVDAMKWANYNGMITGTEQGYANPQGATQRIHATKILYGFGKVCNIGNFE